MKTSQTASTLIFFLMFAPTMSALAAGFPDVPSTHSHYEAILYVQAERMVSGYPDGTFRPDVTINRAEFTKIIVTALHAASEIQRCDSSTFPDLQRDAWYVPYICMAQKDQFINGYPNGTFGPDKTINFVEAAKIFSNVFNTLNTFCSGPAPIAGLDGCPITPDHPWYEWFVRSLEYRKAIPQSITSFNQYITRGEMVEMIWRLREVTNIPSQTYSKLAGTETDTHIFTLTNLHVGDTIGGMTVAALHGDTVDFMGSILITGSYKDWNTTNDALGVCMHSFSAESVPLVPTFSEYVGTQFCFEPSAELYRSFPRGTKGTATVKIKYLTLYVTGGDAPGNAAVLEKTIQVIPNSL